MAEDPEKRFQSIMDKLCHAPKSLSLFSSSGESMQSSRGKKRANPSDSALAAAAAPSCRPWDRGDFMRRLAKFKSMTWFAKPKVVSAVNCARRGWINVDMDILACESCGARLLFSTPSSWTLQQVEKAALVFSLKLDNGHKLLCPWIDNACEERLAEFPPTPPPVLVDKFRERSSALSQLLALPLVSSAAIEHMRSPQLDEFLKTVECSNASADIYRIESLGNQCKADSASLYYQAQKLLSLCGWEPRTLSYIVDCKDRPKQPDKDVEILNSSHIVANGRNQTVTVHPVATDESVEVNEDSGGYHELPADPHSTVLDCKLCGASVGLWTFSLVSQPVESFRLVGYTEVNSKRNSGQDSGNQNHVDDSGGVVNSTSNGILSSTERPSDLNMTIAGGPPPTKQNFKATISLPVIGRNLRARFSYDPDFRDRIYDTQAVTRSCSENKNQFLEDKDHAGHKTDDQGQCGSANSGQSSCLNLESSDTLRKENSTCMSLEGADLTGQGAFPETVRPVDAMECPSQSALDIVQNSEQSDRSLENSKDVGSLDSDVGDFGCCQTGVSVAEPDATVTTGNRENHENDSMMILSDNCDLQEILGANISGSNNITHKIDSRAGEISADIQNTSGAQAKSQEGIKARVQIPVNSDVMAYGTGSSLKEFTSDKAMEFDPIRQHRHFCPWIVSAGSGAPGWQQTLSALQRQKDHSHPSTSLPSSASIIKVDDPIASVRKLFMSPSSKRMKPTCGSS